MKNYVIFLLVFFKMASAAAPVYESFWIAWNTGQGQWVTHVTADECFHFDAGGEPGTFKLIRAALIKNCGQKKNILYLSHWDMDHYLHIPFLAKSVPKLCWQYRPKFGANKPSAQKIISLNIPNCEPETKNIFWIPTLSRTTNESSAIFKLESVLLPGDSPTQQEKIWSQTTALKDIKILILGHHGSRSSTGENLLSALPSLKWTIASARWIKYRHPHKDTLKRLFDRSIPVLRTEDWGNIRFE